MSKGAKIGRLRSRKDLRRVSVLEFLKLTGYRPPGSPPPLTKDELLEIYRVSRPTWRKGVEEIPVVAGWDMWYERNTGQPAVS